MKDKKEDCAKIRAMILEGDTTSPEVQAHLDSGCRECAETARIWQLVRELPQELLDAEPSKELDDAIKAAARKSVKCQLSRPFPAFLMWAGGAAAAFALSFIVLFHQPGATHKITESQDIQSFGFEDWDMTELNSGLTAMTGTIFDMENKINGTESNELGITQAELDFAAYQGKYEITGRE